MSASSLTDLDLREQIARIDRTQAELSKLLAEQPKLVAETAKLTAETRKLDRDRRVSALLAITGLIGGIVTVVQLLLHLRGVT